MADLGNDIFKTLKGHMDIYKTAFDEGYKWGYEAGKRDVWVEVKNDLEKTDKTLRELEGIIK